MFLKGLFGIHFMASQLSRLAEMTKTSGYNLQTGYKTKLLNNGRTGQYVKSIHS